MIQVIKVFKEQNKRATFAAKLEIIYPPHICSICQDPKPTIIFLPCYHVAAHLECFKGLVEYSNKKNVVVKCPECREKIVLGIDTTNKDVVFRNMFIRGFDEQMIKYAAAVINKLVIGARNDKRVKHDMIRCGVLDLLEEENELRKKYKDVIEDWSTSRQLETGYVMYSSLGNAIRILEETAQQNKAIEV